ncbi:outer membrane family protein [Helicobacter sp. 11S02629-2]|uniref:outer membrane family protein n=1 Tax=Helicobacter sp. 11S02629-2 TaxID=1476195 RepID=UPI000BA68105|nr:outer membrane family protein [Helicobacter sp. 11S02629-2]PAF44981.1 hypothetical protein BKH40_04665 [Helicobacter sp. 11S02629-2]
MKEDFLKKTGLVLAAGLVLSLAYADESTSVDKKPSRPMVRLDGYVGTFSKFGFNDQPVDVKKGQFPTESFTTVIGQLDLNIDPSEKLGWEDTSLTFDVGATLGGLAYDSTKFDNNADFKEISPKGGLNYNYFGYWGGYDSSITPNGNNTRNFMIHNAYVDFKSKYFDFIGGRFESNADYLSGYMQGIRTNVHYKFGESNEIKAWWVSSFGRAFAYSQWLYDYYAPTAIYQNFGPVGSRTYNLTGIHIGGIDLSLANADGSKSLLIRPFTQFMVDIATAVGGKIVGTDTWGDFKSTTQLMGYYVYIQDKQWNLANGFTPINGIRYYRGQQIDRNSYNISLIQTFNYLNYNFGLGLYKNFGYANAYVGTIGNKGLKFDFWTSSVYEIGQSLSDAVSRNAFTGYAWVGGTHDVGIGDFTWTILARYTTSTRSEEQSIYLDMYQSLKYFGVGMKLEYFRDRTNQGFDVSSYSKVADNFPGRVDDRSHIFFYIDYKFSTGLKSLAKKDNM